MSIKHLGAVWLFVAAIVRAATVTTSTMTALRSAIQENDWEAAASLTSAFASLNSAERAALLQELEAMTTRVRASARGVEAAAKRGSAGGKGSHLRSVSPAYQWAQNSTVCFVEVKYAAKWGAPAATGAKIDAVDFINADDENGHSTLRVKATTPEQVFELDLALHGALDSEKSSWNTGSVGRVNVVLVKAKAGHWSQLTSGKAPPNAKYWFELQESLSYGSSWMRSGEETSQSKEEANAPPAAPAQPEASESATNVVAAEEEKTAKTTAPSKDAIESTGSKVASSRVETILSIDESLEAGLAAAAKRAEVAQTAANSTYAAARNESTAHSKHRKETARAEAAAKRRTSRNPPRWLLNWFSSSRSSDSSNSALNSLSKPSTIGAWAAQWAVQSPAAWSCVLWVEHVRGSAVALEYEKKITGGSKKAPKLAASVPATTSSTFITSPKTGQFILLGALWLAITLGMYGCIELAQLIWLLIKSNSKLKASGKAASSKAPKIARAVPTQSYSWLIQSLRGILMPCAPFEVLYCAHALAF